MAKKKSSSAKKKPSKQQAKVARAVKAGAVKAKATDLMRMPSEASVKSTAIEFEKLVKEAGGVATDQSELMAAAKKKGIHPGEFKAVAAMKRQILKSSRGANSVATRVLHRDHYMEVLGVNDLLKKQGEMFARSEVGEKETPAKDKKQAAASKSESPAETDEDVRPRNLRQPDAETPPPTETAETSERPQTLN